MELWFHEREPGYGFAASMKVKNILHQEKSDFQQIEILETESFGRMLVLDGMAMVTERDEFFYHEMIIHPGMCSHPDPKRVLVIGGGDGGTAREALRYPGVQVDMVEIDERVVRVSQEYLPTMACEMDNNPRLTLYFEDGVEFMKNNTNSYDLIFVDSTDPEGLAEGLITEDFYQTCKQALRSPGAIVLQSESPLVHQEWIKTIHKNLGQVFKQTHIYLTPILFYPTGLWSFTFASDELNPLDNFQTERSASVSDGLHYYNPTIHQAAFAQPGFVQRILAGGEGFPTIPKR